MAAGDAQAVLPGVGFGSAHLCLDRWRDHLATNVVSALVPVVVSFVPQVLVFRPSQRCVHVSGHAARDDLRAYMWLDLAATRTSEPNVRKGAVKTRERVEARMSPAQKSEARRSAEAWKPKKNKLFVAPTQ